MEFSFILNNNYETSKFISTVTLNWIIMKIYLLQKLLESNFSSNNVSPTRTRTWRAWHRQKPNCSIFEHGKHCPSTESTTSSSDSETERSRIWSVGIGFRIFQTYSKKSKNVTLWIFRLFRPIIKCVFKNNYACL